MHPRARYSFVELLTELSTYTEGQPDAKVEDGVQGPFVWFESIKVERTNNSRLTVLQTNPLENPMSIQAQLRLDNLVPEGEEDVQPFVDAIRRKWQSDSELIRLYGSLSLPPTLPIRTNHNRAAEGSGADAAKLFQLEYSMRFDTSGPMKPWAQELEDVLAATREN